MKTFNQIKEEILRECEQKITSAINLPNQTDYTIAVIEEMRNKIKNIDNYTIEEISRRMDHVIKMAQAGKSVQNIIQYNLLGITEEDYEIVDIINQYCYNKAPILQNEFIKMVVQKINMGNSIDYENEENKMRM